MDFMNISMLLEIIAQFIILCSDSITLSEHKSHYFKEIIKIVQHSFVFLQSIFVSI